MYVRPVTQKQSESAEGRVIERGGCVVTWNVQSFIVTAENNTVETGLLFFVNSVMKSAHKEHIISYIATFHSSALLTLLWDLAKATANTGYSTVIN